MIPKSRYCRDGKSREIPPAAAERAATRYEEDADGCYVSTYSTGSHGYAQVGWQLLPGASSRRIAMTTASRATWTHFNGPIPQGMTVDHICLNRRCVRIDHLRLLTNLQNASEGGLRGRLRKVELGLATRF